MSLTTIRVRDDAPIKTISPRLYGHVAEHLGRCCYGGLRDAEPKEPRADVVAALRAVRPAPAMARRLLRGPYGARPECREQRRRARPGAAGRPARRGRRGRGVAGRSPGPLHGDD